MDAKNILEQLATGHKHSLPELPETHGIYALWDHDGHIRYIGCTPKKTEGFKKRINSKHVTGSVCRSHKFSEAYCTGRMWRYSKHLERNALSERSVASAY